jgi:hypothetical protein
MKYAVIKTNRTENSDSNRTEGSDSNPSTQPKIGTLIAYVGSMIDFESYVKNDSEIRTIESNPLDTVKHDTSLYPIDFNYLFKSNDHRFDLYRKQVTIEDGFLGRYYVHNMIHLWTWVIYPVDKNIDRVNRIALANRSNEPDGVRYFNINEHVIDKTINNPNIFVVAKRGSGSFHTCVKFLNTFSPEVIENSLIISPNEMICDSYSDSFPEANVVNSSYNETTIKNYLTASEGEPGIIILDDCMYPNSICVKQELFKNLMDREFREAQNKIVIHISQFPPNYSSKIINTFDIILLFQEDYISMLNRLYDKYVPFFPSFDSFNIALKSAGNVGCMVIANRDQNIDVSDKVFYLDYK